MSVHIGMRMKILSGSLDVMKPSLLYIYYKGFPPSVHDLYDIHKQNLSDSALVSCPHYPLNAGLLIGQRFSYLLIQFFFTNWILDLFDVPRSCGTWTRAAPLLYNMSAIDFTEKMLSSMQAMRLAMKGNITTGCQKLLHMTPVHANWRSRWRHCKERNTVQNILVHRNKDSLDLILKWYDHPGSKKHISQWYQDHNCIAQTAIADYSGNST